MEVSNRTNTSKKPISSEDIFLKFINTIGPIAAALLAILPIALYFYGRQPQKLPVSATFVKNNQTIQLEVAKQQSELYYGLKFRNSIPENRGMLFVVDRAEPIKLWMKDTYVPLDMIFMRDGVINDIVRNVVPCNTKLCPTYGGNLPANQIIEIPGGKAAQLGIKVGDKISINFYKTPSN